MASIAENIAEPTPVRMTSEEFLRSNLRLGPGKHELIHGVVVAMAPASPTHAVLQNRLGYLLTRHFEGNQMPCRAMAEAGVKPRLRAKSNLRVPDLLVTCGAPPGPNDRVVDEPIVVIEILSPSNRSDPDNSIIACATIPSVKEMLVVDSQEQLVEVWRRDEFGNWPFEGEIATLGGSVALASIGLTLSLADIYAGTHLSGT